MPASQENVSDTELLVVADTMLSLGTEHQTQHHNHFQTPRYQ